MAITANPSVQNGALMTGQGTKTFFDIAAATVIKSAAGRIAKVSVIVAGSTNGAIYDATSTSGNTAANQLAVIPEAVGVYLIDMPAFNGIVIAPGTSQVVTVSYQ